jgi:uncharacterized membrane protein
MAFPISKRELLHAQIALFAAVALQGVIWKINDELLVGPQYIIIPTEIILAILVGFTASIQSVRKKVVHHALTLSFLGLISLANFSSLVLVLNSLIVTHADLSGVELLTSAIAIFMTNIIVYALWYWEIDSPGLTGRRWTNHDKDFQFTQQDMKSEFPGWRPAFFDYFYVSLSNAINFASSDTKPLTHTAKALMGSQALISVLTLALVIARSVSILGT